MNTSYRRYEILLPLRYNNGQPVPIRLITETILDLRRQFGAASCETQIIHGEWEYRRDVFRDQLVRLFVDVPDRPDNRQFFLDLKSQLKERFQQLDIWLTSHPIDVL